MNVYLLQIVNGIGVGMLYFLLAVGWSIVFGLPRFVNFAHGAFYLLGAYFCYQAMQWSMSFWTALVVVPCKNAISHNEIEDARADRLEAGCNALLQAMLDAALKMESANP